MDVKPSVLYITYDGLTDPLGQAQVIPYVEGLSDKGYHFIIMSYEKAEAEKKYGRQIGHRLHKGNIRWKRFRYHKGFSIVSTVYDLAVGFFYLLFAIPKNNVRIIHCRSYISSILGLIFKKLYGAKFIFDMRGFWADERVEGGILKKGTIYKFFKWLEKKFLLNADATIALTRNAINEIATWKYMTPKAVSRLHHITTCCDTEVYRSAFQYNVTNPGNGKTTFLYVGSIGPWQSFREISSFIDFAYHYLPTSRFQMIVNWGTDHLRAYLEKQGYDFGRFDIRSSLPHDQIPEAMKNADVGFFFYPPDYGKKGCSPTKMGEMMAAGIPVITGHSVGDVDELINDNDVGFSLRAFTDEEYKKAIDHVLARIRQNKPGISNRCLSIANDYYSLKKGVDHYANIYQTLM